MENQMNRLEKMKAELRMEYEARAARVEEAAKATTVRETLKAHTELESCSKCHRDIDPLGLAMENYDAIGGWRTSYPGKGGAGIDATAMLPAPPFPG